MPPTNDSDHYLPPVTVLADKGHASSSQAEALFATLVNQYQLDGSLDDLLCDLLTAHIHANSLRLMILSERLDKAELPF